MGSSFLSADFIDTIPCLDVSSSDPGSELQGSRELDLYLTTFFFKQRSEKVVVAWSEEAALWAGYLEMCPFLVACCVRDGVLPGPVSKLRN